jgi:hypothetical protein
VQSLEKEKKDFFDQGFITFNIGDQNLIDSVNTDIDNLIKTGSYKTNSAIYSYNQHPRIVESYKFSDSCKKLALHSSVINRLKYFYGSAPKAFSTINFLHSTQQPLHSDYVHFGTLPHRMLVGAWVALEDIDPNSGPLQVVPKSHKLDLFDYEDVDADTPKNLNSVKSNYQLYEQFVTESIEHNALKTITPTMKKGDCLLWEANLLHGSPECKNSSLTRKSQVTHWTFANVQKHYNPPFSNIRKNIYVERRLTFIN